MLDVFEDKKMCFGNSDFHKKINDYLEPDVEQQDLPEREAERITEHQQDQAEHLQDQAEHQQDQAEHQQDQAEHQQDQAEHQQDQAEHHTDQTEPKQLTIIKWSKNMKTKRARRTKTAFKRISVVNKKVESNEILKNPLPSTSRGAGNDRTTQHPLKNLIGLGLLLNEQQNSFLQLSEGEDGNHEDDVGSHEEDGGGHDEDSGSHEEDGGSHEDDGGGHEEDGGGAFTASTGASISVTSPKAGPSHIARLV